MKLSDCKKCLHYKGVKLIKISNLNYLKCDLKLQLIYFKDINNLQCSIDKVIVKTNYYTNPDW